jgi:hypothetical protein
LLIREGGREQSQCVTLFSFLQQYSLIVISTVMTRTLLSLALTSRRWTSSAVRALYFDPTRCLALSDFSASDEALRFLQKLIRRPGLAAYVHSLDRLPSIAEAFFEVCCQSEELQAATWTLDVLRRCSHVQSIAISPATFIGGGLNWREEVGLLKDLRHLSITSTTPEAEADDEGVMRLLRSLGQVSLSSLTLERFCLGDSSDDVEECEIKAKRVELIDVCLHQRQASLPPFFTSSLQHLRIQPEEIMCDSLHDFLLPSLLSFTYESASRPRAPPDVLHNNYNAEVSQEEFRFDPFPLLPHLTHLILLNVYLDLSHLTTIAANAPSLQSLDLEGSTWVPADWEPEGPAEETVKNAILRLPSLPKLALGWVPVVREFEMFFIKSTCKSRGVELSYKRSLLSRKKKEVEL